MATPLSADRMVKALKAEGVAVKEYRSWRTHNRNHKGSWGGVNGVVIHHTAGVGSGMADFCYDGTSSLPGPLCHAFVSKKATVYLIGHGRANHAGSFARNAHDAVVRESSKHPRPDSSEPIDGNRHYYGIEIENRGDGEDPYPKGQYEQAVRWAAAICRAHKWTADSVIGHKEGTRRKIDPSFSMAEFRRDVADRLKGKPGSGGSEKEADMPIRTSLGKDKAQSTGWGDWTVVRWDVEHADPAKQHGDGNYPGYVPSVTSWADFNGRLRITGLEPGDQVQVRYEVHDWKDGKSTGTWTEVIADHQATPGDQFLSMPFSKGLKKGQHVYVAVKPIPGPRRGDAASPKVTDGRWAIRQDQN
ncbi:N-acetylmuramoyl-L-alanine amidase [Streptomyces sp. N2-109]|uniref:N-acetylmuramoyl-L-alanine amidase n=1 Tax=Streptomyces gossypii TaxID=2883101 RepID=A0ABT2JZ58_9ACTN|nr:peptidoglycan recognition family protein [Streptomyces gossypii]MCT2593180.1 N-acetylmuramoyl-L-alanine amidase [Streptomyces gossypii]